MNNPILIYNTEDGKTKVSLYTQDGTVWLNQNQLAELFATSVSNINKHIANILKEGELSENSVIEYFSITAINGSYYNLVL
ncbi:DNA-binding protein [Gallibacterium anatis]|uniref:DNA-binding protein n=1 Tax=Gallibacterium anatis TaxID=750 RepID=UPI0039FC868E